MESVETHFPPEALKFLRGLARHNDREWFEARRFVYEQHLKAPMLALIEELNAALIDFAPDHVRTPAKTMMRIYRDTRFSNDKRPYKKHIAAWFGRRGAVRTTGPGFYLHISPSEVHFAAGVFMPLPEHLFPIRQWLAENHERYNKTLKQVTQARRGAPALEPVEANALARMPKGFAADHPAGELLRSRRWGVHHTWPAETALQPDFAKTLTRLLRGSAPVVLALDEALDGEASASAKKRLLPLF